MRGLPLNITYIPPAGKEYTADAYPGDGLYQRGEDLFLRYTLDGSTTSYVTGFLSGARLLCGEISTGQCTDIQAQPVEVRGISEDFVLKAMAIAQNPQLAATLIK